MSEGATKPKRKVRKAGFEGPFSQEQIVTWVVQPIYTTLFYVMASLLLKDQHRIIFLSIYSALLVLGFGNWLTLSLADPAFEPMKSYGCLCMRTVQQNAQYCQVCRKSVMGLDHHCTWLNTCIGRKNYHFFYTLVFTFWGTYLIQMVCAIMLLTYYRDETMSTTVLVLLIIECVAIFPMLGAFTALLSFHTYLLFVGYGTYEFLARRREKELKAAEGPVDAVAEQAKKDRIAKKQAEERALWLQQHRKNQASSAGTEMTNVTNEEKKNEVVLDMGTTASI